MRFDCKNCTILMEDGKGKVYQNSRLMFKGDSYIAIKFMLEFTENAEEVLEHFRPQLNMREQVKWKKQDETAKRMKKVESKPEPPQREKVIRRPRQNKMEKLFNSNKR